MQNDPQNNPQNNQVLPVTPIPALNQNISQNTSLEQDPEDLHQKKLEQLHNKEIDFKNSRNSKMGFGLILIAIAALTALMLLAFSPHISSLLITKLPLNSPMNFPLALAVVSSISTISSMAIGRSGITKNKKVEEEKKYDGVHTTQELANQQQNSQQLQNPQSQQSGQSNVPSNPAIPVRDSWTEKVKGDELKSPNRSL